MKKALERNDAMSMSSMYDHTNDTTTPYFDRGRVLPVLLLTWFVANALTHVIVVVAIGDIYYKLPFLGMICAESSIAPLNFLLPVLAVRYFLREPFSFSGSFGSKWTGWKIPVFACVGFITIMLLSMTANRLFAK